MLVEGFISYHTGLQAQPNRYDSFFLFENGFVGCSGLDSFSENGLSHFVHYTDEQGRTHQHSYPAGQAHPFNSKPENVLTSIPELHIGVWFDRRSNQLHLFRNVFGFVPLYYSYLPGKYFAFSTDVIRLVRMAEVQKETSINVGKIILHGSRRLPGIYHDASSTFFSSVESVLPGHILTADAVKISLKCFVKFEPQKWSSLQKTGEYSEALRDVFKRAVNQCISKGQIVIGAHLSGGLDSSSVVSMARNLHEHADLHTFHILSTSKLGSESHYADEVARKVGTLHHLISSPRNDLETLEFSTNLYGQPDSSFLSPAANIKTMADARDYGCHVLLNGFGGDSVIGNGLELITQAFESKDWHSYTSLLRKRANYSHLASEDRSRNDRTDSRRFELALQNSLYLYFSRMPKRSFPRLVQLYRSLPVHLKPSILYFLKRYLSGVSSRVWNNSMATGSHVSILRSDIDKAYDHQISPISFPTAIRGDLESNYQELFEDVFHPLAIRTQEEYFVLGNYYGVRCHSPFMNRELFELNLAIPNIVKFGDGIGRAHLRESMKGILPEKVRLRSTKATLSSSDGHEMTMRLYEQAKSYLYDGKEVWQYIDRRKFDEQIRIAYNMKVPYGQKTQLYFLLTRTISLAVWLEWLKKQSIIS